MYQKYQTEALILKTRESGEADKLVTLVTKDFGLVRARASGVRAEHSKMRYALQNYARANVSLVKGKRGWRVAGATALAGATGDTRGVAAFARVAELTIRLVHGEERNDYLFAALSEMHAVLFPNATAVSIPILNHKVKYRDVSAVIGTIEIVCVARVLYALGYISTEALSTALFTHTAYTGESLLEAESMKDKLLVSINRAIAETHL